jgi:uncharacterized protein
MMNSQELNDVLRELACRYADLAQEVLGEQLVSIALYGSVARGEAGPNSDIDLFVVLKEPPKGMLRRRALLGPVRERLTPELEKLWSRGMYTDFIEVIRSQAEAHHFHPLYLDMTAEANMLYDSEGFLGKLLHKVQERLNSLGAQRRKLGRLSYWDLQGQSGRGAEIEL